MRALIVCDNHARFPKPLLDRTPAGLLPVGARPLLFHMLDHLAVAKVRRVTLAVADQAQFVQAILGDGSRLGVSLDYLPVRPQTGSLHALTLMEHPRDDDLLVLPGLVLTDLSVAIIPAMLPAGGRSLALAWAGDEAGSGAEVLYLSGSDLARRRADLADFLRDLARDALPAPGSALHVRDLDTLRAANVRYLAGLPPFAGRDFTPRGHNCRVHPRADILEPVLLGQDVEIGAGCRIGPLAVIGDNCIVDDGVEIRESLVLPGTFAGRNTTLENSLACQDLLVNLDDATCLHVPDPFILGAASAVSLSAFASALAQRALAVLLLLAGLPLLAAMALRPGRWRRRTVVVGQALASLDGDKTAELVSLRDYDSPRPLLRLLAGLFDVARGTVNLVGVEPLTPEQAASLEGGFAEVRFACRAGLLAPWDATDAPAPDDLERRAMEVFYVNTRCFTRDMRLCFGALRRMLRL